jgi:hypothetical protein
VVRYVRVLANLLFLRTVWEAAVAALWTFVLIRYIVFELVSSFALFYAYQPHPEQLESLARFASGAGAALLLALFVALGSWRATREDSRRALERGALIGTASVALLNGMVAIWFPPVDPAEIALQLPAALAGGLFGAARGRRRHGVAEAATALAWPSPGRDAVRTSWPRSARTSLMASVRRERFSSGV